MPQPPPVVSTFDVDMDCWTTFNDAEEFAWVEEGGNPGGHVRADDQGAGLYWYWVAPGKFLGDKSASYGGTLSFDLRLDDAGNVRDQDDVVLVSEGGAVLLYRFPKDVDLPSAEWQQYTVPLEAGLWQLGGQVATESEIQSVLADLATLRIRAEYIFGDEVGFLDNVTLGSGMETDAAGQPEARFAVLEPAYPNPFVRSTSLAFSLAEPGPVRLAVYDVLGREVVVLVEGQQPAGPHQVQLHARDLATGIYLYRLQTAETTLTRRVLLAR